MLARTALDARSAVLPTGHLVLALFFVASGFSAVAYQVVLSRYTQLIVGATAYAISALLVAFMLGMSIGSALGGRWADATRHPLRLYAIAEGAIGVYCAAFPLLFPWLQELYLQIAPPLGSDALPRSAVRFLVGVLAFLLPSVFMGITTPAFARAIAAHRPDRGRWLARVYGWNTFGAAAGAFLTAYLLVPMLGLVGSILCLSTINLSVAVLAWRRSVPVAAGSLTPAERSETAAAGRASSAFLVSTLLFAAFASGLLSFALEIIWTHLLAVLLGNSVYAFGLMLGSLLLGLSLGSLAAERLAEPQSRALDGVGVSLALAGLSVLLTLGVWDEVPRVFLLFARSSPTFALMEAVRFAVALVLMLVPTALFGISFPLVLRCASSGAVGFGARLGAVYAVNTMGAVAGALLGSYYILPRYGSLDALRLLGGCLLTVGGLTVLFHASFRARLPLATVAMSTLLWVWWLPVSWDFNALNMAAAIYLGTSTSQEGNILFKKEDPTGGLTTVVEARGVRTLLTNGKFQGDDSEEVPIQHRAANIPTLLTPQRERALVIGLGTGVTLSALAAHGFKEVVCAELSNPIVEAAALHFAEVNRKVLQWPSVRLVREDGRSVLMESPDRYDVISVEITSIWFAGVGSIYSQEFYELAARRLRRNGVLLQWFPVHHLSARNLYLVVNTVRKVFPYVSVWNHRHQGFVVASNEPLRLDVGSIRADAGREELREYHRELESGTPLELLSDLVVTDRDVDRFLDAMARLLHTHRGLVSTDTWPVIEYETPKDVLNDFSYFQNRALFRRFRSREPFPFRGQPTAVESAVGEAAFSRGWSDPRALPRLAALAARHPAMSALASRWLFDEFTEDDVVGTGYPTDPVADLHTQRAAVERLVSTSARETDCRAPEFLATVQRVPLAVEGFRGISMAGTRPSGAIDGASLAELGQGWQVRPDGRLPRLELGMDRPRRLRSVQLVVQPLDGLVVRTRLFGRDGEGGWHPLSSGGQLTNLFCNDVRVYELGPDVPPLTGLRLDLQGQSLSSRIAVHEVWAEALP